MPDMRVLVSCLLVVASAGCTSAQAVIEPNLPPEPNMLASAGSAPVSELDATLELLSRNLKELHSCRLEVSWRYFQPLLETSTVRTGVLYYKQSGGRSHVRIDFASFRQDQEKPQPLREEIIFDGIWLTRIDHQLKEIKRDQLAPDNEPLDAFQLLTGRIPIVGFDNVENLKEQFEITMESSDDPGKRIHLVLLPQPDSDYASQYKRIEILTKATEAMPQRIRAVTVDDDLNEIVLKKSGPQDVADSVFVFDRPRNFTIISKPLENGK